MSDQCVFDCGYAGRCQKPAMFRLNYCEKHIKMVCKACGAQATHECDYCGQFVCGAPLCDDCEGWEDRSKPSGSWGFLNHLHRRKT